MTLYLLGGAAILFALFAGFDRRLSRGCWFLLLADFLFGALALWRGAEVFAGLVWFQAVLIVFVWLGVSVNFGRKDQWASRLSRGTLFLCVAAFFTAVAAAVDRTIGLHFLPEIRGTLGDLGARLTKGYFIQVQVIGVFVLVLVVGLATSLRRGGDQ